MDIDVISDTHFDFWTKKKKGKILRALVEGMLPKKPSTILVVAGDLSHSNTQTYFAFKILKETYEHIVYVHGNHDLYLINGDAIRKYKNDSFNRLRDLVKKLGKLDNVHYLDGNIVEIDGIKFGGNAGWYDGEYSKQVLSYTDAGMDCLYQGFMDNRMYCSPDNKQLDWRAYCDEQKKALRSIVADTDVMVTHHIPIWEKIRGLFANRPSSGFFHFDGYDIVRHMKNGTWIYGHTHDKYSYTFNSCQIVCNPFGYPRESSIYKWDPGTKLPHKIRTVAL